MDGSDHCYFTICSSDRKCPRGKQKWRVNLANTLDNYEIVVLFDRINKQDAITRIGKFYHLFAP